MLNILWQDGDRVVRHADTIVEMKGKVREACKLMAEEYVSRAAANEPVGIFRRVDHPIVEKLDRKPSKIMPRLMEETHEAIRAQFWL